MRDYYKIMLLGGSGRGKTYSFRNLDKEKTFFINIENKPLPFKGRFTNTVIPNTPSEVLAAMKEGNDNKDCTTVVIDSFSAYLDLMMRESKATKKGYDVFNHYNEGIAKFHDFLKRIKKEVFVTAHYEIISDELTGSKERRAKCNGKQWEGFVEKEYTIVLFTDAAPKEGGVPEHFFTLVNDGTTSTKCPPDIFGEGVLKVPNDAQLVYEKIQQFIS